MKATRPLNNTEIRRVSAAFTGIFDIRNRLTFFRLNKEINNGY